MDSTNTEHIVSNAGPGPALAGELLGLDEDVRRLAERLERIRALARQEGRDAEALLTGARQAARQALAGPAAPPPAGAAFASREERVSEARRCFARLRQLFDLDQPGDGEQRHWHRGVPALARAAADTVEDAGRFFPRLPLDAGGLRDLEERVRQDQGVAGEVVALREDFARGLRRNKALLYRCTYQVIDTSRGLLALDYLSPADRQALEEASLPLRRLLDDRNRGVAAARRHNQDLRQEAQAEVEALRTEKERLDREQQILLGQGLHGGPRGQ